MGGKIWLFSGVMSPNQQASFEFAEDKVLGKPGARLHHASFNSEGGDLFGASQNSEGKHCRGGHD